MWAWLRRRRTTQSADAHEAAREELHRSQARLSEAMEHSVRVDRLAMEVRRALGGER